MAMYLQKLLQEKRQQILQLADKHGAFNVRVFGSVVRGEDTPESDIDFLVDYDPDKTTPWFPGGLLMDLQELLGRKVDVLTEDGISVFIKEQILTEAQLL
ncbi:toxin-antitoxin system antidote component [Cyanobacterium sp. HL-69]|nr:toxin-antitoxin system antidote component [Cyanobacterium sp. HL-69]